MDIESSSVRADDFEHVEPELYLVPQKIHRWIQVISLPISIDAVILLLSQFLLSGRLTP